jgi:hypothetical protein
MDGSWRAMRILLAGGKTSSKKEYAFWRARAIRQLRVVIRFIRLAVVEDGGWIPVGRALGERKWHVCGKCKLRQR